MLPGSVSQTAGQGDKKSGHRNWKLKCFEKKKYIYLVYFLELSWNIDFVSAALNLLNFTKLH